MLRNARGGGVRSSVMKVYGPAVCSIDCITKGVAAKF